MKATEAMAGLQLGGLAVIGIVILIVYWRLTHFTFPDITGMWRGYSKEKSIEAGAILEPTSVQEGGSGVGAGTVAPLNTILVQGKIYSYGTEGIAEAQSVTERTIENNYGMIGVEGAPRYDIINQAWE
jgi:hypothetical protein